MTLDRDSAGLWNARHSFGRGFSPSVKPIHLDSRILLFAPRHDAEHPVRQRPLQFQRLDRLALLPQVELVPSGQDRSQSTLEIIEGLLGRPVSISVNGEQTQASALQAIMLQLVQKILAGSGTIGRRVAHRSLIG